VLCCLSPVPLRLISVLSKLQFSPQFTPGLVWRLAQIVRGKQASRRLAAIQSSVAPSSSKVDIHTSQAALFVNPCPTPKERRARIHARPQPANFRNSAMDVRDAPREVVARSLTAAEQVTQSPNVFHTRSCTASLITVVNCYSSGRRDDSWRRELGTELKRYLCSYCTSRLGAKRVRPNSAGFAAASSCTTAAGASELDQDAPRRHRQGIPPPCPG